MLKTEMPTQTADIKNIKSLKEIMGISNLQSEKLLRSKLCNHCSSRPADSVNDLLCSICYRKLLFNNMPEEEKQALFLSVVPKRFIMAEIEHLSKEFRENITSDIETGVYLWGMPGVGKSYALCAVAKESIKQGYKCQRIIYEHLCLKLRDTFKSSSNSSEWEIIKPLIDCDKLFIEDIGTTKSIDSKESDFSLRTLLLIIDMRLEACLPTYITTNKSVENLAKSFDQRIGDRLRLYTVLNLQGESKR